MFASSGKCIRFAEKNVSSVGRTARGVIGIRMPGDHKVVSMLA